MRLLLVTAAFALSVGALPVSAQSNAPSGSGSISQTAEPGTPPAPGLGSAGSMRDNPSPVQRTDPSHAGSVPQTAAQNQMYKPKGTTGAPPYGSSTPGSQSPGKTSGAYQNGAATGGTSGSNTDRSPGGGR